MHAALFLPAAFPVRGIFPLFSFRFAKAIYHVLEVNYV